LVAGVGGMNNEMIKLEGKIGKDMNIIQNTCMMAKSSVDEFKIIIRNMQSTVEKMSAKLVKNE
jgi:hypothetical protein